VSILSVEVNAQLEQQLAPNSRPKLFFTISDNSGDQFHTSIAKEPREALKSSAADGHRKKAEFWETYSFDVREETNLISIKVLAAIVEGVDADEATGEEITTSSERQIQAFKYRLNENYAKLFD
jgi:hypothetical protein